MFSGSGSFVLPHALLSGLDAKLVDYSMFGVLQNPNYFNN